MEGGSGEIRGLMWEGDRIVTGGRAQGGTPDTVVYLNFMASPSASLKEEKLNTVTQCPQRMKAAGSSWDKPSLSGPQRHTRKKERGKG